MVFTCFKLAIKHLNKSIIMKTLKFVVSFAAIVLLLFSSCKKEPVNTTVTTEDLLDYQICWFLTSPDRTENLRALYFTKTGTEIQATLDGITSRVIKTIKVEDNTLILDLNDNGSVVYTFQFTKNRDGIAMDTSKFYNINNPNFKASQAALLKTNQFFSVKNKAFKEETNKIIRFNNDTWLWSAFPNVTGTYYEFGTGGWKGKMNGVDYMGIFLNSEKVMFVQKFGDKNIFYFIPH